MRKILIVAQSEFGTLVRSKAFIVSLVAMPLVMALSVVLMRATKNATDGKDRTFAVVDYTGVLVEPLVAVAQVRNAGSGDLTDPQAPRTTARFIPVEVKPDGRSPDDLRLELSDRVRREELFAFVEVPADILDPASKAQIRYHSDHPSYNALPIWLRATVNGIVLNERFRRASIDRALVARLTRQAPVENLGLFTRESAGNLKQAEAVDQVRAQGVPLAMLVLMFVTVMSSAPQLLNSVIEEKMSRISEVMLGSVDSFELMMGKLIGNAGVALVLAAIYVAGGFATAAYYGYSDVVSPAALLALGFFVVVAVVFYGSLYMAVGAACSELKDAQSLMMPVMILSMLPAFCWTMILNNPNGPASVGLSLFPPATPFLMLLRMLLQPSPPAWQVGLSVVLTTLTSLACVWAAGKVFRTGILMQGKAATLGEMARWVLAK
jgi:ABC-2 type transport system permease protein